MGPHALAIFILARVLAAHADSGSFAVAIQSDCPDELEVSIRDAAGTVVGTAPVPGSTRSALIVPEGHVVHMRLRHGSWSWSVDGGAELPREMAIDAGCSTISTATILPDGRRVELGGGTN